MKNLTLMAHDGIERTLADLLRGLVEVSGFAFTRVEGHSVQDELDPLLSPRDHVVGYTPHVRVDILLRDEYVDTVLAALSNSQSGVTGKVRYWLTTVEREGQL